MRFVKKEDLKTGMRLARPIYNKKGVLLFERDSRLTQQAIESVHNFGLLGIYVLDPAEPLPPLSDEDIEFERFQTVSVSSIREEITKVLTGSGRSKLEYTIGTLTSKYGHLDKKIHFYQYLRSEDDYVYRHVFNVAVLCTMITHRLNVKLEDQRVIISAAILHDLGKLQMSSKKLFATGNVDTRMREALNIQNNMGDLIENLGVDGIGIRRICSQFVRIQMDMLNGEKTIPLQKITLGTRILLVANRYDELTAMDLTGKAQTEVKALQEFREKPEIYDPEVVKALTQSVHILFPGVGVILEDGRKALVIKANDDDVLRPVILGFDDNKVLNLGLFDNRKIKIVDIMKTLDNRYIMDMDTVKKTLGQKKEEG